MMMVLHHGVTQNTAAGRRQRPITPILTTSVADRWNPKGSASVVRAVLHWRIQNHPKETERAA